MIQCEINIVNKRTHIPTDRDAYIGRGSPLGNKWTHLKGPTKAEYKCETREESINLFKTWLNLQIFDRNQEVLDELNKIYRLAITGGVNLVCFCDPANGLSCHGEVIARIIEEKYKQINSLVINLEE